MYFPAVVLWQLCNRYQITLHERPLRTTAPISLDNAGQQYAPVLRITALGFSHGAGLWVKRSHRLNPLKARVYLIPARVCQCAPDRCNKPCQPSRQGTGVFRFNLPRGRCTQRVQIQTS